MDVDRAVRVALFESLVRTGRVPAADAVARAAGLSPEELLASYHRLADAHVIVLRPGTDEVWMANPFSAVETPFDVSAGERRYHGNCIWDALGIIAMLGGSGTVRFPCPDCGEPLAVEVEDGEPRHQARARWRRRTPEESRALFAALGLTGPFWTS